MPVSKLQVFLASRFEEFTELRKALVEKIRRHQSPPADAIDLNDNAADSRPPINRCRESIESADVVVVLIGETYGGETPEGDSYTHLEYRHARACGKTLLVFLIGEGYAKSDKYRPNDSNLSRWIDELYNTITYRCLDPREGSHALAADIYTHVLERLWQAADEAEMTFIESGLGNWEESPVRTDELTNRRDARRGRDLRALASDHAHEAFEALELNLPQIAVHHLELADQLVRLEPVPGYWLARLLLATSKRADWKRAQGVAVRCAGVADARNESVPELLRMACLVVATRASEQLGDRVSAQRYAQMAHEDKPFHWFAKLELARQFAKDDDANDALSHARQAFWLRPATIYKIQSDPVFIELGDAYQRFRRALRTEVTTEVGNVLHTDQRVVEFAKQIGIAELHTPTQEPKGGSLLSMIDESRVSARRTLQLLRHCASKLARSAGGFVSGPYAGLTDATADRIQRSIATESASVATLQANLTKEIAASRQSRSQMSTAAVIGAVITLLVTLGAAVATDSWREEQRIWLLVAIGIVGIVITAIVVRQSWDMHVSASERSARLRRDLDEASSRLAVSQDAASAYDEQVSDLGTRLREFCTLTEAFENTAGKRLAYAPAVPPHRQNTTDIIRIDESKVDVDEGAVRRDSDLLPPELASVLAGTGRAGRIWFARRVKTSGGEVLSRAAAYFT